MIPSYAYSQIRYLSLPIPPALALFTLVLPLITGISTRGAYGLIQRSKNEPYQLTIPLIAVIGFQLIYETIVVTLSLTYILPPSSLVCGLHDRWQKLYAQKSSAIRTIQDSFDCCGFKTVGDRSFPFQDSKRPTCAADYHRSSSCWEQWRQAEQTNAGLLLLVAVIVFIVKVLSILSLLTTREDSSWSTPWIRRFKRRANGDAEDPEDDHRASMRRLIEDNANREGYHDGPDESVERGNRSGDQGPRVEPSPLTVTNEWHDEGTSRA
ncbi:uncharacterized protein LY89DRAFT_365263 [Mollisia scopiformis]|uniref:Tetraspanin Tsp3 n=1 Tax=Mollisia scopiformis TaxID=149040 RepID=A0A132B4R4_MOLSC|nr:uncharacterized protein LY89DRAFT_365263 [Mollisia scopiformis]KUJ07396.1 hypothetical protein LY89DRAFT_365263 [Mollisia scopiformis]